MKKISDLEREVRAVAAAIHAVSSKYGACGMDCDHAEEAVQAIRAFRRASRRDRRGSR